MSMNELNDDDDDDYNACSKFSASASLLKETVPPTPFLW